MSTGTAPAALEASAPIQRSATVAAARSRLALLDGMRLFAAAGIVWVHAAASEAGQVLLPVGTFGVPFYIFVAVLFMSRGLARDPNKTVVEYALTRFWRVYLPFLFWSAVYVFLTEAKAIVVDRTLVVPPWTTLYAGGHQHLWFLPFLMMVTIIGALLVRGVAHNRPLRYTAITLLIAAGVVFVVLPEPAWVADRAAAGDLEFWRFAFRAMPTACWALALALATTLHGSLPRTTPLLAAGGVVLFAASLLLQHLHGPLKVLRAAAGFGCLLVALLPIVAPLLERVGRLGRYSYGIYLAHVLFLRIIVMYMDRAGVVPTIWTDIGSFVAAFGASLGLSMLLAQSPRTKWVLGE